MNHSEAVLSASKLAVSAGLGISRAYDSPNPAFFGIQDKNASFDALHILHS